MKNVKRPGKNATDTQREKWKNQLKNETKEQKFVRVAQPIFYRAIKQINRLSKMVGSPVYATNFNTVNSMTETLHNAVNQITSRFNPSTSEKVDVAEQETNKVFGESSP